MNHVSSTYSDSSQISSEVVAQLIEDCSKEHKLGEIDWVPGRGIFEPGIKGEGMRSLKQS